MPEIKVTINFDDRGLKDKARDYIKNQMLHIVADKVENGHKEGVTNFHPTKVSWRVESVETNRYPNANVLDPVDFNRAHGC